MDGVLVIDKPRGLTSHDVVAAARRLLGETRIGHTGTLDPLATGVLPLACGRATRLVRFLSARTRTTTRPSASASRPTRSTSRGRRRAARAATPSRGALDVAPCDSLEGEQMQVPPAYSAKKVGGRRAYDLARRDEPVDADRGARARLAIGAAGVRRRPVPRLAHLFRRVLRASARRATSGQRCGTGACLEALQTDAQRRFHARRGDSARRPAGDRRRGVPSSGARGRGRTRDWNSADSDGTTAAALPAVTVTAEGLAPGVARPARQTASTSAGPTADPAPAEWVRLLDASGALVGLGTPQRLSGFLHPEVVPDLECKSLNSKI